MSHVRSAPRLGVCQAMSLLLALALLACAPPPGSDAGTLDGGGDSGDDAGLAAPDELRLLDELSDLALLENDSGAVKYLAPVAGAPTRAPVGEECVFQNTARYPYHLEYLHAQAGGEALTYNDYLALVLRRPTRAWWGGEVRYRESEPHPLSGEPGVLVFTLYTEDSPGNRLEVDDVRAVHAALTTCAPAFVGALAFAPSSNEQRSTTQSNRDVLESEGIAVLIGP